MLKAGEVNGSNLKRNVDLFQAVMYGVGLILGAGIYVLIGDVAAIAGNAMWISFGIAAIIAAFTGLSYAELSSMFPKSAAEYVFVKNAFQKKMIAFVAGWLIIFVAIVSSAAVAIGFSGYLTIFFPQFEPVLLAVALIIGLSAVNFVGIRESMWMNTTFTLIELAGLAIVVIAAVLLGSFSQEDYFELPAASASFPLSFGAILAGAGLVFFAYYGFENLANVAEETKNASKTIPKALIISIITTTVIYILVAMSAIALVGWENLSFSDAPLALVTEKAFGKIGVIVLSAIALFATSNTVLMMLVAGSRIVFGMAKERALPTALGRIHFRTKTPWSAIVLTTLLTIVAVVFSGGSILMLANIAVFAIFMVYAAVNMSLIWLRYKHPQLDRPFKSPISIGWFPVLAGLGLATSLAMLTQFDSTTMSAGAAVVATGLASYAIIGRTGNSENRGEDKT